VPAADKLKTSALVQIAAIDRQRSHLKTRERHIAYGGGATPDDYADFNAMCLAVVDRVTGRHDAYYERALREIEQCGSFTSIELAQVLHGLVRSLKRDIDEGWLATFREIEHADVYNDLLDSADRQASQGQIGPALIVIRSVLEGHLRQLAVKYDIALTVDPVDPDDPKQRTTPQHVNDELAQVAYGQAEHKSVGIWLRQGAQANPNRERTIDLATQVRNFIAKYPA
jgi:predicted unusual protein kinase regulating ubiquinone biosynthesis (AarF/ABC1/UbiB family)